MQVLSKGKLVFLIDEMYIYEGIKFYGSPWIKPIEFQEDRWAFSRFDTYEDIPQCDILLTHDNPFCNEALDVFSFGKSKYHLYGHWHDGSSDINSGRYNCSRLNNCYSFKKNYEFVVLDVMTEKEKKQVDKHSWINLLVKHTIIMQQIGLRHLKKLNYNKIKKMN